MVKKDKQNTVEGIVKQKKNDKNQKKDNYIFPKFMADAMSKVDLRLQYESGMMSMSLMAIGLIVSVVYMCIYVDLKLWYKIFLGINGLAGLVFIAGYVITTYQQYKTYLGVVNFQKETSNVVPSVPASEIIVNPSPIEDKSTRENNESEK